ncbi:hypothetical protein KXV85_004727, partial [Aspergillus fumigatus]
RERRGARLADPPGGEMAVQNGVDLVGALRRLIDALRIERDDTLGVTEHLEEGGNVLLGQPGGKGRRTDAAGDAARTRQRVLEAAGVAGDIVTVERAMIGQMDQQAGKQRGVGARFEAQEQIDVARGVGAARIDHDHACAALLPVLDHALEQHGVAPGRVRADEDQEIGTVEII